MKVEALLRVVIDIEPSEIERMPRDRSAGAQKLPLAVIVRDQFLSPDLAHLSVSQIVWVRPALVQSRDCYAALFSNKEAARAWETRVLALVDLDDMPAIVRNVWATGREGTTWDDDPGPDYWQFLADQRPA